MMTHECYECVCLCFYICMLALLAHNSWGYPNDP
jgi:hypothetical protein